VLLDTFRELALYPHDSDEATVIRNSIFSGTRTFEDTFVNRIHKFLEQVSADVRPEEIDGSGADGLAAQRVIQAAIESLESGTVVQV